MKIAAWTNPSGSRYWRIEDPFKHLRRMGIDARVIDGPITEEIAQWADIYVLQGTVDKQGIALLRAYQAEHGKKIVVDRDDALQIQDDNPYKADHERTNAPEVVRATMQVADLITTTTPYLAKACEQINDRVVVLPNLLDLERWDLAKRRNTDRKLRIGWAGSITHLDDLKLLVEPLTRIKAEFAEVDVIIAGDPRARELFPFPVETVLGVPFTAWPARLHGLRLDIAVAPLKDTPFNRCKSNIKFLEYAVAKIPGVYSPTVYHQGRFEPDFGLIARNEREWYACLRNLIVSAPLREDIARHAYSFVKAKYDLARGARLWAQAYAALLT